MRVSVVLIASSSAAIASFAVVTRYDTMFQEIAKQFAPHARVCLAGDPMISIFFVVGHLLTSMSYVIIPALLIAFANLVRRYSHHDALTLCFQCCSLYWPIFAAFIFFCGGSHFLALLSLYTVEFYWLEAAWILFGTGVVSAVTASALMASYGQAADALAERERQRIEGNENYNIGYHHP